MGKLFSPVPWQYFPAFLASILPLAQLVYVRILTESPTLLAPRETHTMVPIADAFSTPAALPQLRGLLERLEHPRHHQERPTLSTGCTAVDRLLPHRGLRGGMLVEWIADGRGSGASVLPVVALRELQQGASGAIVVVDREGHFYPPAASAWGIDLANTMAIRPTSEADELWAIDQALRTPDVAAVLAWPAKLDGFTFRRLQLAAESSGAVGLLVRPRRAQSEPTWATARLLVSPLPTRTEQEEHELPTTWQLEVTVLKSRGARAGHQVQLDIDHQTGNIHESTTRSKTRPGRLAAELAPATACEQTA